MRQPSIGVAILTFQARDHLNRVLPFLLESSLEPRVLVVDSSSTDGTVEEALRLGAETLVIQQRDFNHGATRELARRHLGTDIVVFMTQDAYPIDATMLDKLTRPLTTESAAVSYARQVPHTGAGIFEAFPRHFNYPSISQTRSIADVKRYGAYTFFCSNSCAAYANAALDAVGGFQPTLIWEDQLTVARLLIHGYTIAYVAEAVVQHSHRYTLSAEFMRYFDTGYVLARNRWFLALVGAMEGRGKEFLSTLLRQLTSTKPVLIPYAVVNTFVKWGGFRVGYHSLNAPTWLKTSLSGQKYYWTSSHYRD